MSLKQKIGQLITLGIPSPRFSQEDINLIKTIEPGGVIYFSRNIKKPAQIRELSQALQNLSSTPLFICTDQEGGSVLRIIDGVTVFPGNMALGATKSTAMSYQAGKITGEELYRLGINMNLAPCLDVNNNPKNPVIGLRSFGEDPKLVADLGSAFALGLQDANVISTGKHFPGHGDTEIDSHHLLPVVGHDKNHLDEVELLPFKDAIQKGIGAIMTAHIAFPAIEENTKIPATLSKKVLTGLLRDELGFKGLIMTDCMEMKAIKDSFGTIEGAVLAIEAGADMILVSHTPSLQLQVFNALLEAVNLNRISEKTLHKAVLRILKTKSDFGIIGQDWAKSRLEKPLKANTDTATFIAKSALTVLKGKDLLPINGKIAVIDFETKAKTIAEEVIKNEVYLGDLAPKEAVKIRLASNGEDYSEELVAIKALDADIFVVQTMDAHLNRNQMEFVKELKCFGKLIFAVGLRAPYEYSVLKEYVDLYLATYSYRKSSLEAAWDVLTGKARAPGILPVTVIG